MNRRMVTERAERLHQIPPVRHQELSRYKKRLAMRGIEPIDLTIGTIESDGRQDITDRIVTAIEGYSHHRPSEDYISPDFCRAFSTWFSNRFDVDLDPESQILPIINTKAGVACVPMALVNPGETVLIPDPAYPAYRSSTIMAGGRVHTLPLHERNDFLPNLKQVDPVTANQAKLLFLSYPNNPTGAVADVTFFREVIDFARQYNIIVCHDATHHFLMFDDHEAPSLLQSPGGKEVGIEIYSLSSLLGGDTWELSVAVGNPSVLAAISQLTYHLNSPLFQALQEAAVVAFENVNAHLKTVVNRYQMRRDLLVDGLQTLDWKIKKPKGSVYLWAPVPPRFSSVRFSILLRKAGIFVVPGSYMGEYGEGYVRLALNKPETDLHTVVQRVERLLSRYRLRKLIFPQKSLV
jgi:LL-diaminopimelate aminotransferase